MTRQPDHARDSGRDELLPDGLSGPVAAATIEVLYRIAEALESRYLGEILQAESARDTRQRNLWD